MIDHTFRNSTLVTEKWETCTKTVEANQVDQCKWYSFQRSSTATPILITEVPNALRIKYSPCHLCSIPVAIPTRFSKHKRCLTTETVEGTALSLQSVDDIKRGDGLALGVLGVGDGITDDTLEEGLEDTTGLFVDHWEMLGRVA